MKAIQINKVFQNQYLTCGVTHDNFIFENCPPEFIDEAKKFLSISSKDAKSCVIKISDTEEKQLEKTLAQCQTEIQRKILARDLFISLFMKQILKDNKDKSEYQKFLSNGITSLLSGDFEKAKRYHLECPLPLDISNTINNTGKIELNIFLINTQNIYLQQAINNFISSREPYSIKLFTTNEKLATYYDQCGNIMQSPHDFMRVNVNKFISFDEDEKE